MTSSNTDSGTPPVLTFSNTKQTASLLVSFFSTISGTWYSLYASSTCFLKSKNCGTAAALCWYRSWSQFMASRISEQGKYNC